MAVTKIRMNSKGALAILHAPAVIADTRTRAERVKRALPTSNGAKWAVEQSRTDRVGYVVVAANAAAREAAAEGALHRALSAGGGR